MRRALYRLITASGDKDYYDPFMMVAILLSLIPLMFKNPPAYALFLERVTTGIFVLDYGVRLWPQISSWAKGGGPLPATPLPSTPSLI